MLNGIKENIEIKSISTSLFGITLELGSEKLNKIEIQEVLRDLYKIGRTLSEFCCVYEGEYEFKKYLGDEKINIEEELTNKYCNDTFNLYENIEKILCQSKYFVLLPSKNRLELLETFDNVRELRIAIETNDDAHLDVEEVNELIKDVLKLYDNIKNEIDRFNNELDKVK